jgi:transcriptional regulator with XRE-family HTH domain
MSRLKLLKKMHKINKEDLAKVLGTNRVQISRYETGKRKLDEISSYKSVDTTMYRQIGCWDLTKINRQNTPRGFRAACLSVL